VKAHKKEGIMDYIQSTAIWFAMKSFIDRTSERRAPGEANSFQPEEEFVPFRLPPVKLEPREEAQPRVAAAA
jgi:hypothetical protein